MRKAFLVKFAMNYGIPHLLSVNLPRETFEWLGPYEGLSIDGRKALILVNDRHIVCARGCPETGKIMLLDTVARELPEHGINLQRFLNEKQIFEWRGEPQMAIVDPNTPQQPELLGGCCVMSMCNYTLPHGVYSSVEDGESMRLRYGQDIVKDVMRGRTPLDMSLLFEELYYSRQHAEPIGSLYRYRYVQSRGMGGVFR